MTVRIANAKIGVMYVSVSGKQFVFPRTCACCGAFPLTHLTVSGAERNRRARTKGWLWDIPYCVACKRHILASEGVFVLFLVLVATSFIGGFATALSSSSWARGLQQTMSCSDAAEQAVGCCALASRRPACELLGT